MEPLVLFTEDKNLSKFIRAADADERGTKIFGGFKIATPEKEGDIKKVDLSGPIVAIYHKGEWACREGIKTLSTGERFFLVEEFPKICANLVKENT